MRKQDYDEYEDFYDVDDPELIDECANCGKTIYKGDVFGEDYRGNVYCDEECCLKFYEYCEYRGYREAE